MLLLNMIFIHINVCDMYIYTHIDIYGDYDVLVIIQRMISVDVEQTVYHIQTAGV